MIARKVNDLVTVSETFSSFTDPLRQINCTAVFSNCEQLSLIFLYHGQVPVLRVDTIQHKRLRPYPKILD
jgi:hypothetical protein